MNLAANIDALPSPIREMEGLSKLVTGGERSAPQHDRTKNSLRLLIRKLIKKAFEQCLLVRSVHTSHTIILYCTCNAASYHP
jgi:hypothetical protein